MRGARRSACRAGSHATTRGAIARATCHGLQKALATVASAARSVLHRLRALVDVVAHAIAILPADLVDGTLDDVLGVVPCIVVAVEVSDRDAEQQSEERELHLDSEGGGPSGRSGANRGAPAATCSFH